MNCLWTVATLGISTRCTAAFSGSPAASIELAVEQFRRALAFSIGRLLSPRPKSTQNWTAYPRKSTMTEANKNHTTANSIVICLFLSGYLRVFARQTRQSECHTFFSAKFVEIKQLASANRNRHQAGVKRNQRNALLPLYNLGIPLLGLVVAINFIKAA